MPRPADDLCVENAIMLKRSDRYPLVIDPSGQATKFLLEVQHRVEDGVQMLDILNQQRGAEAQRRFEVLEECIDFSPAFT
jgi:hypothetical protein